MRQKFVIQVHGGAWDIPADMIEAHRLGVTAAYARAEELLKKGETPLRIVVESLEVMENDPTFDAGKGSFLNENGDVELDAGIMEGTGLKAGAVAGIGSFPNPSRIALSVLEHTEHVLLVGQGAETFATQQGFEKVDPRELIAPRSLAIFESWEKAGKPDPKIFFSRQKNEAVGENPDRRGTVGVTIALEGPEGNYRLFAGTSTGGTPGKRAGRVGDVPLVGCGFYADDEGAAVSCTGWGEGLMRIVAAKNVSQQIHAGTHPQEAVEEVLLEMFRRTGGRGGIIAIDSQGRTGAAYTTPEMAYAGKGCVKLI